MTKDQGWFTSYTAFDSHVVPIENKNRSPKSVAGVGTVEIPVKAPHDGTSTKTIRLEEVLHVPRLACNVISLTAAEGFTFDVDVTEAPRNEHGNIADRKLPCYLLSKSSERLACLEEGSHYIQLHPETPKGKELGPSIVAKTSNLLIAFEWEDSERKKWHEKVKKAKKNRKSKENKKNRAREQQAHKAEGAKSKHGEAGGEEVIQTIECDEAMKPEEQTKGRDFVTEDTNLKNKEEVSNGWTTDKRGENSIAEEALEPHLKGQDGDGEKTIDIGDSVAKQIEQFEHGTDEESKQSSHQSTMRSESEFLRQLGLDIEREEDRKEGIDHLLDMLKRLLKYEDKK